MTDTTTERELRRSRWRSHFEQTLLGPDSEVEAATVAAMAAVDRGEDRAAIMAAGLAAAKRQRAVRTGDPHDPVQPRTPATPLRSTPPPGPAPSARPSSTSRPAAAGRQGSEPFGAPPTRTAPAAAAARSSAAQTPARSAPRRTYPPDAAVVRFLEKRNESMDGEFFQLWAMRLFRIVDGRAVPPPIPVEIRGRSIVGQLVQGDVVLIPPGREGSTRIVKSLRNLTTETTVEAKGRPFRRARTIRRTARLTGKVVFVSLALAVMALVTAFILSQVGLLDVPSY